MLHEQPARSPRYFHGRSDNFDQAPYLAFQVARVGALGQAMGKLGHEGSRTAPPRYWSFPLVFPMMTSISTAARVLDRVAPDKTEALCYMVFGHAR